MDLVCWFHHCDLVLFLDQGKLFKGMKPTFLCDLLRGARGEGRMPMNNCRGVHVLRVWLVCAAFVVSLVASIQAGQISGKKGVYQWGQALSAGEVIADAITIQEFLDKQAKSGKPKHCIVVLCACSKDPERFLYLKHVVDVTADFQDPAMSTDMEERLLWLGETEQECGGCREGSVKLIRLTGPPKSDTRKPLFPGPSGGTGP